MNPGDAYSTNSPLHPLNPLNPLYDDAPLQGKSETVEVPSQKPAHEIKIMDGLIQDGLMLGFLLTAVTLSALIVGLIPGLVDNAKTKRR